MGERRQDKKCLLTSEFCDRLNKIVKKEKWSHQQIAGWSNTDRATVAKVLKNDPNSPFHGGKAEEIAKSILSQSDTSFEDIEVSSNVIDADPNITLLLVESPFYGAAAEKLLAVCAGRDELLERIFMALDLGLNKNLLGGARLGKTWLLKQICLQGATRMRTPIEKFIYINLCGINHGKQFFPKLCEELEIDPPLRGGELKRVLGERKYVVCLDNIDQFRDKQRFTKLDRDQLCYLCDGDDLPLTMVVASQKPLRTLFPDDHLGSSPFADLCNPIEVQPVSLQQATNFMNDSLAPLGMKFKPAQIEEIHRAATGKPQEVMHLADEQYQISIQNRG
jgi:hypothetical protein